MSFKTSSCVSFCYTSSGIAVNSDAVVKTQQLYNQEGFLVNEAVAGEDIMEQCCGFGVLFPNLGFSLKHSKPCTARPLPLSL